MEPEERENFEEYAASVYRELLLTKGQRSARLWFWSQFIRSLPRVVIKSIKGDISMLKNYLKTAIRNIRRQKLYSLINISGLAVGLVCCMLILLWVHDEWSYDRFHKHADQIHRAIIVDPNVGLDKSLAVTPIPLAPAIKNEIPEITHATRISPSEMRFVVQDSRFDERGLLVSPDFFKIFSFPFIQGDPEKIMTDLNTVAISEKTAKKFFGTIDPIGQILRTERGPEFLITGVFQDTPSQSHLRFDYLMNFRHLEQMGRDLNRWMDVSFYTYLMLEKNASIQNVIQKITECHNTHLPDLKVTYRLQPLKQLYLDPPFMFDNIALHGSRQSVIIFSIIAVAILIIACINFINLSTARAVRRSMEVGLRKVVGAKRSQLIRQFFSESALVTIMASLLAFGGMALFLPAFNTLVSKQISAAILKNGFVLFGFLSIILLAGLGSGTYPALYLSSFQPVKVIKRAPSQSMRGSLLRKMLIVFQFTLTIVVMTYVLTLEKQLRYIRQMDLGYDKSHLLAVPMQRDMARQYETVKQELLQSPNILNATATANLPMHLQSATLVEEWEGKATEAKVHLKILWVDEDYVKTFRMEMAEGNFFSKERSSDQYGFVLNQAAVRAMALEDPIGKRAIINETEGYVIGVVKDFHFRSLHHAIEPMVFINEPVLFYNMVIRLAPNALRAQKTIQYVETLWKKFAPDNPFIYSFLDKQLNSLYHGEQLMGTIFRCFSGLTIFIACFGLLGMASFTAEQRTKEIGIRKVLGASVPGIVGSLVREFTKWVVLANLLAWPVAYYFMNKWLQNFAYRTGLSIWIFLLSGLAALGIALFTVSYKSIKAATANPVDSLRYE
jgi:ABC-type antimicrobial peptide transport system permease subunit